MDGVVTETMPVLVIGNWLGVCWGMQVMVSCTLIAYVVMDDSRIQNRKSRFFPRIEKNRNLDFMMPPAVENSLSLATDVAGIASRRRATLATSGYDVTLAAHQRSGHWSRAIDGAATYRSNTC